MVTQAAFIAMLALGHMGEFETASASMLDIETRKAELVRDHVLA